MRRTYYLLAAGALTFALGCSQQKGSQNAEPDNTIGNPATQGQSQQAASNLSSSDRQFIEKAAQGGRAEVELGQLASEKASSSVVKQFGQRMVDDHSKANQQLQTIASNKGISLPDALSEKDSALKDQLSKLSGRQFDRAYMSNMVKDHTQDVQEFQTEANEGSDSDVKAFASQTLPTLQEHLQQAQQAASGKQK